MWFGFLLFSCVRKWDPISRLNVTDNQWRVTIHRISRANQLQWKNSVGTSAEWPIGQTHRNTQLMLDRLWLKQVNGVFFWHLWVQLWYIISMLAGQKTCRVVCFSFSCIFMSWSMRGIISIISYFQGQFYINIFVHLISNHRIYSL